MGIAENLYRLRMSREMSQEDVAKAVGVTHGAVSQWESSFSEPRRKALEKLAELFGTTPDILTHGHVDSSGMIAYVEPIHLDSDEISLFRYYRSLNQLGRESLINMARTFSEMEQYKSEEGCEIKANKAV